MILLFNLPGCKSHFINVQYCLITVINLCIDLRFVIIVQWKLSWPLPMLKAWADNKLRKEKHLEIYITVLFWCYTRVKLHNMKTEQNCTGFIFCAFYAQIHFCAFHFTTLMSMRKRGCMYRLWYDLLYYRTLYTRTVTRLSDYTASLIFSLDVYNVCFKYPYLICWLNVGRIWAFRRQKQTIAFVSPAWEFGRSDFEYLLCAQLVAKILRTQAFNWNSLARTLIRLSGYPDCPKLSLGA